MSLSLRQQIISAWADTLRATGQFQRVEDAEPYNYDKVPLPACWIIEGDEQIDYQKFFGKAECDLTVITQVAFRFDSANAQQSLYRTGRMHLAGLQQAVMDNFQWGGLAVLTLEQGNAIGRLDAQDKPFGVLTMQWVVRYRRDNMDPSKR